MTAPITGKGPLLSRRQVLVKAALLGLYACEGRPSSERQAAATTTSVVDRSTTTTGATSTTGFTEPATPSTGPKEQPTIPEDPISEAISNGYTGEFVNAGDDNQSLNGHEIPLGVYKEPGGPYQMKTDTYVEIYERVDLMGLILDSFERPLTYTDPGAGQVINYSGHYLNVHFGFASDGTPIRSDILVGTSSFPDQYSSPLTRVHFDTLYVNGGNRDPDVAAKRDSTPTEPTDENLIERFTTGPGDKGEYGKQALFSLLYGVDLNVWSSGNPQQNQPALHQYSRGIEPTFFLYESVRNGLPFNLSSSPDAPYALSVMTVKDVG